MKPQFLLLMVVLWYCSSLASLQAQNPFDANTCQYALYEQYLACENKSCATKTDSVVLLHDSCPYQSVASELLYYYFLSIDYYYKEDIKTAQSLVEMCDSLIRYYDARSGNFWFGRDTVLRGMDEFDLRKARAWVEKAEGARGGNNGTLSNCPQCPTFPIPPPAASATEVLNGNFFEQCTTLGQVSNKISDVLRQQDYERSYYALSNHSGFAIVARIEQMSSQNAQSADPRWEIKLPPMRNFGDYLKNLIYAREGYYRIIVFVVSNQAFSQNSRITIKRADAIGWLKSGLNTLPTEIALRKWTEEYQVTTLIYEFKASENNPWQMLMPGAYTVNRHLEAAKLGDLLK